MGRLGERGPKLSNMGWRHLVRPTGERGLDKGEGNQTDTRVGVGMWRCGSCVLQGLAEKMPRCS